MFLLDMHIVHSSKRTNKFEIDYYVQHLNRLKRQ